MYDLVTVPPTDIEVIKCFKSYYRKRAVRKLIQDLNANKTPEVKSLKVV
jgi:hypothetical protein